jgi:hypothetical protein
MDLQDLPAPTVLNFVERKVDTTHFISLNLTSILKQDGDHVKLLKDLQENTVLVKESIL